MKNFNLTFYFNGEKHCVKTSAEQFGINFCYGKILEDLADGANTHVDVNKPLAEYQKENQAKEEEYAKVLESNDLVWDNDGKEYKLLVLLCDTTYLQIFDEKGHLVCSTRYYLTPID